MSASTTNGSNLFSSVGCAFATHRYLTTGPSHFTGMSNVTYHPYSDFALHHMGSAWRMASARGGRAGSVPHRAAVGRRPAAVFPA